MWSREDVMVVEWKRVCGVGGVVVRGLGTMLARRRAEIMPKHKFGFGLVPESVTSESN